MRHVVLTLALLALQSPALASTCPGDPHEPNDSLLRAAWVDLANGTQDLLCQPDPGSPELDVHLVHVWPGCTIRAELLFSHAEGDLSLRLVRANGTVVASVDSADDNELILTTLAQGGVHALEVRMTGSGQPTYELQVALANCPSVPTCP